MEQYNKLMQDMVNKDFDELVAIAQNSLVEVLPVCKEIDPDNNGMVMLVAIILSAVAADGKLTVKEKEFLKAALGLSDEAVDNMVKLYNGKEAELVDKFADSISTEIGAHTAIIVSAVAACDETINRDENAFIQRIIKQ